mgnify:CR=1 FL=1
MIQTVLKRDGRVVGFNEEKIVAAVRRAMLHTDKGEDMQLAHEIADRIACRGQEQMSVEDIQNCVEIELMKSRRKDVAQLYIAYRISAWLIIPNVSSKLSNWIFRKVFRSSNV